MSLAENEKRIDYLRDKFLDEHPDWPVFAVQHDPALHRYRKNDVPLDKIDLDDLYLDTLQAELKHYPGLKALAAHTEAHRLYQSDQRKAEARELSEAAKTLTGIEIHPETTLDPYTFIDHGNGVVLGAQAHLGRDVQIFKGVTLGSFGRERNGEPRHPTIGDHVILSDSAQILGNCEIGVGAKIGPGAQIINAKVGVGAIIGPGVRLFNQEIGDGQRVSQMGQPVVLTPVQDDNKERKTTSFEFAKAKMVDWTKVDALLEALLGKGDAKTVASLS